MYVRAIIQEFHQDSLKGENIDHLAIPFLLKQLIRLILLMILMNIDAFVVEILGKIL